MRGRFVVPAGWGQEAHCDEHSKKGSSAHVLPFGRISVRIVARAPRAVRSARDGVDSTEDRAGGERPTIDNIGAHRSSGLLIPRGGIVEEELVERTSGRRRVSEEGHGRRALRWAHRRETWRTFRSRVRAREARGGSQGNRHTSHDPARDQAWRREPLAGVHRRSAGLRHGVGRNLGDARRNGGGGSPGSTR